MTVVLVALVADAAVTNVTGSNSVNVFLGLGLSWCIAAIYWPVTGRTSEWLSTVRLCMCAYVCVCVCVCPNASTTS